MRSGTSKRKLIIGGAIAAVVIAAAVIGFVRYQSARAHEREVREYETKIRQIGGLFEAVGLLSQADYVKLREIGDAVVDRHTVSDAELDWLLATMRQSHETIVHARVLAILLDLKNPPPDQKEKIASAIVPMLQSKNEVFRRCAARIQRNLGLSR